MTSAVKQRSLRSKSSPINVRSCGAVIAGVSFFPLLCFPRQEPRRHQGERLMMMPTTPIADLVVGQTSLAFSTLQAIFHAVLHLGHLHKFLQRRFRRSKREVIVMLERPIRLKLTSRHQSRLEIPVSRLAADLHTGLRGCNCDGTFLSVAYGEFLPRIRGQRGRPLRRVLKRRFARPPTTCRRGRR